MPNPILVRALTRHQAGYLFRSKDFPHSIKLTNDEPPVVPQLAEASSSRVLPTTIQVSLSLELGLTQESCSEEAAQRWRCNKYSRLPKGTKAQNKLIDEDDSTLATNSTTDQVHPEKSKPLSTTAFSPNKLHGRCSFERKQQSLNAR